MTSTPNGLHPVVVAQKAHRSSDLQPRIADAITAFAGSMVFVYLHAVGFAAWMLFVEQETELKTNTDITRAIHELTLELHRRLLAEPPS